MTIAELDGIARDFGISQGISDNDQIKRDWFKPEDIIEIEEKSGVDLTNYQVLLEKEINENDRFTHQGRSLDYWKESESKAWIEVDKLHGSMKHRLIRWSNPSASSASDGEAVFEFFDDFSNADEWEVSDGISIDTANKKLVATNVDRSGDDRGSYKDDIGIDGGSSFKMHGSFKWTGSGGNCAFSYGIASAKENTYTVNNFIGFYFHDEAAGSDASLHIRLNDVGAGDTLWNDEDHFNVVYNFVIIKNGNNLEAKLWDSSHSEENPSFTASLADKDFSGINFVTWQASNLNTGHSGSRYYFSGDFYNPIFIRKYTDPEPSVKVKEIA